MFNKTRAFLADVKQEMSKVSWPSFDELRSSTVVVIVVSFIITLFIFGIDRVLTTIVSFLLK
ncbi:preprotein translocase subunit SecE [bacterium SM23_31]|nr:MAG: preprotein translocase subunit SecE [bacterium SM23_31]